ncbi:hypothetical protein HKCCE3408_17390 [Rhodobacterales bacterium HKCCE3408]|nr:hypothetical protein [Rhodobacterales bacterium HKCCE3408]
MRTGAQSISYGILVFLVWVAATWLLEGRIETLLRPDAIADRLTYTLVANVGIGIVGAAIALRYILGGATARYRLAGFAPLPRTLLSVVIGLGLGLGLYLLLDPPTTDPVVILNAYAQVFVVSAAEVLVCWALLAGVIRATADGPAFFVLVVAALVSSVAFGLYHFAHSPPFDTLPMVAFLTGIGLVTSVYFLVSRDIYGTILFHNFLGTLGVAQALDAGDRLGSLSTLQVPLLGTAVVSLLILVACDHFIIRHAGAAAAHA